jgi:hypothetical protein
MEITRYETEDYVGGTRIIDIKKALAKNPADDTQDDSSVS